MTDSKPKATPLHVETLGEKASDAAKQICDDAPDKEKCEEFVDRLGEAANNIDEKSQ